MKHGFSEMTSKTSSLALVLTFLLATFSSNEQAEAQSKPKAKPAAAAPSSEGSSSFGKQWNVTTEPISFLLGNINAQVHYAIHPNWTVGGGASIANNKAGDISLTGSAFSFVGKHYFSSFGVDTWYAGAGLGVYNFTAKSSVASASSSGTLFAAAGGYHWFWDSFNLFLGLAVSPGFKIDVRASDGSTTTYSGTAVGLDFGIGWAF